LTFVMWWWRLCI